MSRLGTQNWTVSAKTDATKEEIPASRSGFTFMRPNPGGVFYPTAKSGGFITGTNLSMCIMR
jgi:hypothetical protein